MSAPPLLAGRGLERTYRLGEVAVPAVRGVDVAIGRGELLVLEGPSGSGKTTLLNLLSLLDRPDAGTVTWQGEALEGLDEDRRSDLRRDHFGFVFQTFNLIPVLSAAENVELPMTLQGAAAASRRARSSELLAAVGLEGRERTRPDLLSGGQRQRVAIARALANRASILFADEPTANLDRTTAGEILDLLRRLQGESGLTCVVATHDPLVLERASRVLRLRDGRVEGGG